MFKRFVRYLYWKYAHEGDPWQMRLVVHYLGGVIRAVEDGDICRSPQELFLSALSEKAREDLKPFVPLAHVHINSVADDVENS